MGNAMFTPKKKRKGGDAAVAKLGKKVRERLSRRNNAQPPQLCAMHVVRGSQRLTRPCVPPSSAPSSQSGKMKTIFKKKKPRGPGAAPVREH